MADYRLRCADALAATQHLLRELMADLDPVQGGFSWWQAYLDPPRRLLASDYLVAACDHVGHGLPQAAWHERVFNEAWYGETRWMRNALKSGRQEAFAERGEMDTQRGAKIDTSVVGFFQACGSTLDLLAALTIGVMGLKVDLVTASWRRWSARTPGRRGCFRCPARGTRPRRRR